MLKKFLLTAVFAIVVNVGFSQLKVNNATGSDVILSIHSWDGIDCGSYNYIGTMSFSPGSTVVPLPALHVGMRVILLSPGYTFVASETEPSTPAACTDASDPDNHIVWIGSSTVIIQ